MGTSKQDIQKALSDIALIRRVLDQSAQQPRHLPYSKVTLNTHLLLQACALSTALALVAVEFFQNNLLSKLLILESQIAELSFYSVTIIGLILMGMIVLFYCILWRAAHKSGESLRHYINRNFHYVQNLSFVSDLLMKFIAVSLVIISGNAQWVAPLLMTFIGDYLLQGRFFTLSTRVSICLGLMCMLAALGQYILGNGMLIWSLLLFSLVTCLSIGWLGVMRRQRTLTAA